jgi:DNA-binding transcriptional regulator LsrR (DeoR family)
MQIPMLLNNKKIFKDLETFHIWGVCLVNQMINSNRSDNSHMSKEYYLDKYIFAHNHQEIGVNAMSISDISGIPRATVIRKLNNLVKKKFLKINNKKQYASSGHHIKTMLEIQKKNFINLSKFIADIYNLNNYSKNK